MRRGFATSQLLAHTFRRYTNRTPTQYRRGGAAAGEPVLEWTEADERRRLEAMQRGEWV